MDNDTQKAIEEARNLLEKGIVEPDSPIGLLAMMNSKKSEDRAFAVETLVGKRVVPIKTPNKFIIFNTPIYKAEIWERKHPLYSAL